MGPRPVPCRHIFLPRLAVEAQPAANVTPAIHLSRVLHKMKEYRHTKSYQAAVSDTFSPSPPSCQTKSDLQSNMSRYQKSQVEFDALQAGDPKR